MKETMGQVIKRLRKASGYTQDQLAEQLNVSAQAVSKWENGSAMPDISQIVPLADVFDVPTDELFGLTVRSVDEDALEIVQEAGKLFDPDKPETLLDQYDSLTEGLKKHPNNLILLVGCMECGLTLSLSENGAFYCADRVNEITRKTIRQASLIISYSKNTADILRAHQVRLLLYAESGDFEMAASEAYLFPARTDYTFFGSMAYVCRAMKDSDSEIQNLRKDLDLHFQASEDGIARLTQAYIQTGGFDDAIRVCEAYFSCMRILFGKLYPSYHDFDSGNLHRILAAAYLSKGESEKAVDCLEDAMGYYQDILENQEEFIQRFHGMPSSPFIKNGEQGSCIDRTALANRIRTILSGKEWEALHDHPRAQALYSRIQRLMG